VALNTVGDLSCSKVARVEVGIRHTRAKTRERANQLDRCRVCYPVVRCPEVSFAVCEFLTGWRVSVMMVLTGWCVSVMIVLTGWRVSDDGFDRLACVSDDGFDRLACVSDDSFDMRSESLNFLHRVAWMFTLAPPCTQYDRGTWGPSLPRQ